MATEDDNYIKQLLLKAAAQGTVTVLSFLCQQGVKLAKQQAALEQVFAKEPAAVAALRKVSEAIAAEEASAIIDRTSLREFLEKPETTELVRQAFSVTLCRRADDHQRDLSDGLNRLLALHLHLPAERLRDTSDAILEVLLMACDAALDQAVSDGVLSAHDAKAAARTNLVLDELHNITRMISVMSDELTLNVEEIQSFEESYRHQVGTRHGHIIPPHLDTARKIAITRLYVPPSFSVADDPEETALSLKDVLPALYRTVILGNPGGGKSTFVQKLAWDLATKYQQNIFAGRQVTPVLVTLRDFGAEKKERPCSILEYIEQTAVTKYQLQVPPGAFEYLLVSGRLLLIFDGLDELLDTSYRMEITGDVEAFCNLYPSVPVVVTSREVGYDQAPLDPAKFSILRLASFGPSEVEAFARKWFSVTDNHLPAADRREKADAFVNESSLVPDLRSNPLMLSLMCNIYRGENYIPKNRPELYAKCATMLFERWDKGRGITVTLPFEHALRPTMHYLADWIYRDERLQGGVTERQLVQAATSYLCPKRFEDRDEAESAATAFIEFCSGRAWVFTDTGTTDTGERLYQFTHRTFLEYFTAAYIVRTHNDTRQLADLLLPRIETNEWDVVAQLAFQLQSDIEGATDILFEMLLERVESAEPGPKESLLYFAARSLHFLVPSPSVVRATTRAVIRLTVEGFPFERSRRTRLFDGPRDLLASLFGAGDETRKFVQDEVQATLRDEMVLTTETGNRAIELALNLSAPLRWADARDDYLGEWDAIQTELLAEHIDTWYERAKSDLVLATDLYYQRRMSMDELVGYHGLKPVFTSRQYRNFGLMRLPIMWSIISMNLGSTSWPYDEDLATIGRAVLESELPLIVDGNDFEFTHNTWASLHGREIELSVDGWFGLFAMMAIFTEATSPVRISRLIGRAKVPTRLVLLLVSARDNSAAGVGDAVEDALERLRFSVEQRTFVRDWIRGRISFVKGSSKRRLGGGAAHRADAAARVRPPRPRPRPTRRRT